MKLTLILSLSVSIAVGIAHEALTQLDKQKLHDRMYQTALRGLRLRKPLVVCSFSAAAPEIADVGNIH